jgi:glucose-6-phosphate isomerase
VGQALGNAVARRLAALERIEAVRRLWDRDPTLWKGDAGTPELRDRLGWLTVMSEMERHLGPLQAFADEARRAFDRVVLLGMGGSSLAPEVLWRTFGRRDGFPPLQMLDSTDPRAVAAVRHGGDPDRSLFIVASKSGTTLETMSLYRYFWRALGGRGQQFVAITDPGTPLERLAREQGFRWLFLNPADIGGRYSALSLFGLVPAALIGVDVEELLRRGSAMAEQCAADVPPTHNPGAWLGAVMGEAALAGRDKLTLLTSPRLHAFGLWVEQLLAESTGKEGKGIVPVVDEPLRPARAYGSDRLFVVVSLAGEQALGVRRLASAGHPVVEITLHDEFDLGAEFFCWEFATAVAGVVLEVNPFDQPNVAESKQNTKRVLADPEGIGPPEYLRRHDIAAFLEAVRPGDYVAVLAFLPPSEENDRRLATVAKALRDRLEAPVTVGYGPRFLHSTGQLHKGGPPRGHFIQLLPADGDDEAIPGEPHSFGDLIAAQAQGDRLALAARGRPVLRVSDLDAFLEHV